MLFYMDHYLSTNHEGAPPTPSQTGQTLLYPPEVKANKNNI